jgi:hypothetical protein
MIVMKKGIAMALTEDDGTMASLRYLWEIKDKLWAATLYGHSLSGAALDLRMAAREMDDVDQRIAAWLRRLADALHKGDE